MAEKQRSYSQKQELKAIVGYFLRLDYVDFILLYGRRTLDHEKTSKISNVNCWKYSDYDVILGVENCNKFHKQTMRKKEYKKYGFFRGFLFGLWLPENHIFLNKINPNYYQHNEGNIRIKYATISTRDFAENCSKSFKMYVKGRMQKPVVLLCSKDKNIEKCVKKSIHSARKIGVRKSVDLMPKIFDFDDLLKKVIALNYIADIRFERRNKVYRIFSKLPEEFKDEIKTYVEEFEKKGIICRENSYYRKRKHSALKTAIVFLYLKINALFSLLMTIKNGITNDDSLRHVKRKIMHSLNR